MTVQTFEEFAQAQLDGLLRFATVLTGAPDTAADAVQDAMVRAHGRWGHIGALDHPVAYVRRIITNEWLGQRRRWSSRHVSVMTGEAFTDFAEHVPDTADRHAQRDDIADRLDRLPRRQRAALVLRYYLDLDDAAIAVELGCAVGTVRSLCSRGIAALRLDAAVL